jgi:hypothetical protein
MSKSALYRTTAGLARKHSRVSALAAAAAAAGVLGAAGFASGSAPWDQTLGNVAKTTQGGAQSTSGQTDSFWFADINDFTKRVGKSAVPSAAAAGGTDAVAAAAQQPAKHQVAARPANAGGHAAKQAAKPQAAKPRAAKAKPQVVKKEAPAAPAKPYTIYDSVSPSTIPTGHNAAVYANGNYAASAGQMSSGYHSVLWIDTNGSDPAANVLDVEPGDATPAGAAQWARERLSKYPHSVAIVYTMLDDWQQVKSDIAGLPASMRSQVQYWIADPTGSPHIVPGSSATQYDWGTNYDLTMANPNFDS